VAEPALKEVKWPAVTLRFKTRLQRASVHVGCVLGLGRLIAMGQQPPIRAPLSPTEWATVRLPHRPRGITAVGDVLWVCGEHGLLAHSNDHGATWYPSPAGHFAPRYDSIAFSDAQHGVALGVMESALTSDGGLTWQRLPGLLSRSRSAVFTDPLHGIADGIAGFYVTGDGGQSWARRILPNDSPGAQRLVRSVAALDTRHLLVLFQEVLTTSPGPLPAVAARLSASRDGGRTWDDATLPGIQLNSMTQRDGRYLAAGTSAGEALVLSSHDGLHWERKPAPLAWTKCSSQGCLSSDRLWTADPLSAHDDRFPRSPIIGSRWAVSAATLCAITNDLRCVMLTPDVPATEAAVQALPAPDRTPPRPLHTPEPDYPSATGQMAIVGRVTLVIDIPVTGAAKALQLVEDPDPDLAAAVLAAVQHWRFAPAEVAGKPIAMDAVVTFEVRTSSRLRFQRYPGASTHPFADFTAS